MGIFFCIIFNIQIGLELIFRTNIQFAYFSIHADNRSQSPTGLVTIQSKFHLFCTTQTFLQIGSQITFIPTGEIIHTSAGKCGKPFINLISQSQLHRVDILSTIHSAVDVIHIGGKNRTLSLGFFIFIYTCLKQTCHSQ